MVDREIFSRRLAALRGCLEKLRAFQQTSEVEFRDPDTFARLEQAGAIPPELAGRLRAWAGFRNILVHQYLDIDHGIAWHAIQKELGDLEAFASWATAQLD